MNCIDTPYDAKALYLIKELRAIKSPILEDVIEKKHRGCLRIVLNSAVKSVHSTVSVCVFAVGATVYPVCRLQDCPLAVLPVISPLTQEGCHR